MTNPLTSQPFYTCAMCKTTFLKGRSDEEARAEYERDWPETQGDEEVLVCSSCYSEIVLWCNRDRLR